MAQYFFDFADMVAGSAAPPGWVHAWPANQNVGFTQSFGKAVPGYLDMVVRNASWTSGDNNHANFIALAGVSAADADVLVKHQELISTNTTYSNTYLNAVFRANAPTDTSFLQGHELALSGSASGTSSFIRRRLSGTSSSGVSGSGGVDRSGGKIMWSRFRCRGTTLQIRSWLDGATEPTTWGQTVTNSEISAAGYIAVGVLGANNAAPLPRVTRIFQIGVGTDTDDAPSAMPGGARAVAGTVRTPTGDLAVGYTVRCYSRQSGALLAEGVTNSTGQYAFSINYTGKVTCIALDQLGNLWNAPIKDLVTPTVP